MLSPAHNDRVILRDNKIRPESTATQRLDSVIYVHTGYAWKLKDLKFHNNCAIDTVRYDTL